jgi:hypothetical protein
MLQTAVLERRVVGGGSAASRCLTSYAWQTTIAGWSDTLLPGADQQVGRGAMSVPPPGPVW